MDIDFNPASYAGGVNDVLAQANLLWSAMNGGLIGDTASNHLSTSVQAHPRFVNDGANSHLAFNFYNDSDIIEVAGAFRSQAEMFANTTVANGTRVNCWDPDGAKRGIYDRIGTSNTSADWSIVTGSPKDKAWTDPNHPQYLLELLILSFVYSPAPVSFMGNGIYRIDSGDWRNARLTFDIRVKNLELGPWGKIAMHVQGAEPTLSAALTESYPESPNPKYLIPNYIAHKQLISDQLGFNSKPSWGIPNAVPIVVDSGRKNVVTNYSTNDDDWICLGDLGRDPTGRLINYGAAPIEPVLADLKGNTFVMAVHETPNDGEAWWNGNNSDAIISDFNRTSGTFELYGIKLEEWVEP